MTGSTDKELEGGKGKLIEEKPELVPPDGGWGWVVVFAFALSNVIVVPILQSFGLLFRGRFEQLEINATDASIIINVNSSFGMILGLFSGYLLRTFGYRKIAIVGSITNAVGVILTSFADSFGHFLITYGFISSIGFNLLSSALNLAINSYFRERRGKAVGFATTAMGLGPVFVPLIISKLMESYGVGGTALLLGGFSLHSLVGALLLQPVKWHMKPKPISEESQTGDLNDNEKQKQNIEIEVTNKRQRTITTSSIDHDVETQSIYGFETPLPGRKNVGATRRRLSTTSFQRSTSQVGDTPSKKPPSDVNWWASAASVETINLGSSLKIFDERHYQPLRENSIKEQSSSKANEEAKTLLPSSEPTVNGNGGKEANGDMCDKENADNEDDEENKNKKKTFWQRLWNSIVLFFDLGLLTDPIYVNLMLGMSLAICGEFNFSLLTPFILNDRGFNTQNTAIIMSVIAALDIVFRFTVPFISDHYKIPARYMYIIALFMLVSSRTALIFSESFDAVMTVAVALGVAKGVRTVYMTIVIPCYVPIERLAAASGIQMVTNGILLLAFGPLIGVIRDVSGSYNWCIAFINMLTLMTLTMWILEILIVKWRNRKQQENT